MKERPILFSGPMIRALLDGRKTQTRRICKPAWIQVEWADAVYPARDSGWIAWKGLMPPGERLAAFTKEQYADGFPCPYGAPGDQLWVRETFYPYDVQSDDWVVYYRADHPDLKDYYWKPSIHMPRALSRIQIEIVDVQVERVQAITPEDARAEGVEHLYAPRNAFATLWDQINGARPGCSWADNPWVWALTFKRLTP